MEDEKINALVQWLNENGNEVSVDDVIDEGYNRYSVNRNDYLVCTDEEADEEFRNSEESIIDDLGIDSFSDWFQTWIFNNAINTSWFEEALAEEADYLASEYSNESSSTYENRLVEECYDYDLITDDDFETDEDGNPDYERCTVEEWDLQDRFKNWYVEQEDAVEWYKMNFGDESFRDVVKEHNLLDVNAIIEEVKRSDGRGGALASYDGNENETEYNGTWYYIYRN